MRHWRMGLICLWLFVGACGGPQSTSVRPSASPRDERAVAGQSYVRLTTQAVAQWKAATAMACNRRSANEETWPVMADYFAVQASIDQSFIRGAQRIKFPADSEADASTAIAAFGLRADDFMKMADQERAHQTPDFTAVKRDGAAAVAASRKLRADLGLPVAIESLTPPCDLSG